jgi:hypothetical protein
MLSGCCTALFFRSRFPDGANGSREEPAGENGWKSASQIDVPFEKV